MTESSNAGGGYGSAFDERAATYGAHVWHVQYAERLVELANLRPGLSVLDAATGTGLAARAAARVVGPTGFVLGVDVSARMLDEARVASRAPEFGCIDFVLADATDLSEIADQSFDVVICSAGLLYMPADRALQQWKRVLKADGVVGFSTMACGSPPAAELFRECARDFGITLSDPSRALGSEHLCRNVLEQAGFRVREIVAGQLEFTQADLDLAWDANLRTAGHEQARELPVELLQQFTDVYESRVRQAVTRGDSLRYAHVLYAFGAR